MSTTDKYLILQPILTDQLLQQVQAAAASDPRGHIPIWPSHACYLGGEIIGSLSCCATPVSGIWAHSEKSNARHTREMVNLARSLTLLMTNGKTAITMCSENSPIYPFMEHMNFVNVGSTMLFKNKEEA